MTDFVMNGSNATQVPSSLLPEDFLLYATKEEPARYMWARVETLEHCQPLATITAALESAWHAYDCEMDCMQGEFGPE